MICAAKVMAMVRNALYRERAAAFATAALLLLSGSLHAQEDCIQLDYADTLDWFGRHGSELMLADHTDMVTPPPSDDFYGFLVRGASSDCLKRFFADYADIEDTCRDMESGRVYTILHSGAGQHFEIRIWSFDPEQVTRYRSMWMDGATAIPVKANGIWIWLARMASVSGKTGRRLAMPSMTRCGCYASAIWITKPSPFGMCRNCQCGQLTRMRCSGSCCPLMGPRRWKGRSMPALWTGHSGASADQGRRAL